MLPPPPRPTLFPYTTLFRSKTGLSSSEQQASSGCLPVADAPPVVLGRGLAKPPVPVFPFQLHRAPSWRHLGERIDRKSTRLNSSHLGISYAVFCLKKKNNKT